MQVFQAVTHETIINMVGDFVSLDISKTATGWVKKQNGIVTHGFLSLTDVESELEMRKKFRSFLKDLYGSHKFEYTFVEDVIGSVNFLTAKQLYQLNPLVDDLNDDGSILAGEIIREDNNRWKSALKMLSGYKSNIAGESDVKGQIRNSLSILGFGDGTVKFVTQDEYDAMGLAVGTIYRIKVLGSAVSAERSQVKIQADISRGYTLKQFDTYEKAQLQAVKLGVTPTMTIDLTKAKRDLRSEMKKVINEEGDKKFYIVSIPTNRIGAIALDKKFDLDMQYSFILLYRTSARKGKA